jgi:hypothetical protein
MVILLQVQLRGVAMVKVPDGCLLSRSLPFPRKNVDTSERFLFLRGRDTELHTFYATECAIDGEALVVGDAQGVSRLGIL